MMNTDNKNKKVGTWVAIVVAIIVIAYFFLLG